MTAVIHHGPPGSYKTFALVQRVLVPALQAGRVVITNVRGFNSVQRVRDALGIVIPDEAQILYIEPDPAGYETIARFFHWAPAGALIVMDEGQRVYPLRERRFDHLDQEDNMPIYDAQQQPLINHETGAYINRPATLEIAIDQHRHFNWDIYISTTNVAKIHGEIRKCVEWAYRHRDNTGLLPWKKNNWSEFRHDAEQSGKSVAHYSGSPKQYKADKRVFACYQSTATGAAKTSNENISVFRDPKLRFLLFVMFCCAAYFIYAFGDAYDRIANAGKNFGDQVAQVDSSVLPQAAGLSSNIGSRHNTGSSGSEAVARLNPFSSATIYFTGSINAELLFEIQFTDRSPIPIKLSELKSLGFRYTHRFGSFVAFDFNGATIYAFSKPVAPIVTEGASIERTTSQLSASLL